MAHEESVAGCGFHSGWPCARWRNLLMMHSLTRPDRRTFLAALAAAPLAAAACARRKYDPARFRRPEMSPVFLVRGHELLPPT